MRIIVVGLAIAFFVYFAASLLAFFFDKPIPPGVGP